MKVAMFNVRGALAMSACAVLLASCGSTPSAVNSPELTPVGTILPLGAGQGALQAGTYRVDLRAALTVGGGDLRYPTLRITVPNGWSNIDGWAIHRGSVAIQFWNVDQVFGHPCQWEGTLFRPGPSVVDLVDALVDQPLRNATRPIDVTIDGYSGKYLEWSVPADFDFSTCDLDGPFHDFESWTGPSNDSDRYQQGPGQVDRLWILDIHGDRLVIDAFDMPSATDEDRRELLDVVASIRFDG